jgi:hypothetical protein
VAFGSAKLVLIEAKQKLTANSKKDATASLNQLEVRNSGDTILDCTPVVRQRNQGQVAIDAVGGRLRAAANGDKFASNSMGGR